VKQLEDSLMQFIDINNENPTPFVWTKSAEKIIRKLARARTALIQSI